MSRPFYQVYINMWESLITLAWLSLSINKWLLIEIWKLLTLFRLLMPMALSNLSKMTEGVKVNTVEASGDARTHVGNSYQDKSTNTVQSGLINRNSEFFPSNS